MSKIAHIHVQSLLRLGKGVYSCCLILCKSYSNLELQFLLNRDVFQASLIPELHLLSQCIHSWKQFLLFPLHWRRSKETVIFFRRISVCISRTHCSLSDKLWAIPLSKHHGGGSKDLGASELSNVLSHKRKTCGLELRCCWPESHQWDPTTPVPWDQNVCRLFSVFLKILYSKPYLKYVFLFQFLFSLVLKMAKYLFLPGRTIMLIVSIIAMQKGREKKQQLSRVSLQDILFMLLQVCVIGPWSGISEIVYAGMFLAIKVDSQVSASSNFTQKVLVFYFSFFAWGSKIEVSVLKWSWNYAACAGKSTFLVFLHLPSPVDIDEGYFGFFFLSGMNLWIFFLSLLLVQKLHQLRG